MGVWHDCIIFDFFYSEYWHYRLVLSFGAKAEVHSFEGRVGMRLSDYNVCFDLLQSSRLASSIRLLYSPDLSCFSSSGFPMPCIAPFRFISVMRLFIFFSVFLSCVCQ